MVSARIIRTGVRCWGLRLASSRGADIHDGDFRVVVGVREGGKCPAPAGQTRTTSSWRAALLVRGDHRRTRAAGGRAICRRRPPGDDRSPCDRRLADVLLLARSVVFARRL